MYTDKPVDQEVTLKETTIIILMLEDTPSDAEFIERVLFKSELNYSLLHVSNKKQYIKSLMSQQPDIILSDYKLPTIKGPDALLIAREIYPNIPFIILTGSLNEEVAVACMKAGADDYILKENLTRLLPAINSAIQNKNLKHEKDKALQDLINSEERFRTLADNISQLTWMADKSGSVFWFNKRWYDFTGFTPENIQGDDWLKAHHPDFVDNALEKFNRSINSGEPWEDIFPLRNSHGDYRWFLSRALPVYASNGEILHWFGTNTDITEQKKLQEDLNNLLKNLQENQSRLIDTQKLALMGSSDIDVETRKVTWSSTMYDIFERDQKLGVPDLHESISYIHPEDREKVKVNIERSIRSQERVEMDFRIILPGNSIKYLHSIVSPYFDEAGNYTKRLCASIDITDRKLAQLQLEEAYKQIESRLKEKDVLLRELYHRTKNNMQVISALLGLKASSFPDQAIKTVFEELQDRIKSIALVHEKLYQSRDLSRINFKEYLISLVQLIFTSHSVKGDKISFKYDLEEIILSIDSAIPCGLIVTELIINSLKHAFPHERSGYIELELKKLQDNSIQLVISDNGIGIKESELNIEGKLGLLLFRDVAENQLQAKVNLDTGNGASWSIRFKDSLYSERV